VTGWSWIDHSVAVAIHEAQIAEHGGSAGVRDPGLLESALARPRNLLAYSTPDYADLAAAYGFGIARNHPFIDGNKRNAFVAVELFLAITGRQLDAEDVECVMTMLGVAAGEIEEDAFAAWIRAHAQPR